MKNNESKDVNYELRKYLIEYEKTQKPEGEHWQSVDGGTYYSRVICCLCTMDYAFSGEVDYAAMAYEEMDEIDEICPTKYGDISIVRNDVTHSVYVQFVDEK